MNIDWPEPTADDVTTFMLSVVVNRTKQDDGSVEDVLTKVVQRVRGTVAAGALTPLSANVAGVPPEAVQHTLILTVNALIASTPNLQFVTKDVFDKQVATAERWLDRVGQSLQACSRPREVHADGATELVRWGSDSEEADMTTD